MTPECRQPADHQPPERPLSIGLSALVVVALALGTTLGMLCEGLLPADRAGDQTLVRLTAQAIVRCIDRRHENERPVPHASVPAIGSTWRMADRCLGIAALRVDGSVAIERVGRFCIDLPPPACA